jgi:hypothetical protein
MAASATATSTAANELIFGAGSNGDGFSGAGTGFTLRMIDFYGNLGEDKTVSSTGSYNVSAPLQKSTVWGNADGHVPRGALTRPLYRLIKVSR